MPVERTFDIDRYYASEAYNRDAIVRSTEDFLSRVTTTDRNFIGPASDADKVLPNVGAALKYATGILGQVKPIIFTIYDQNALENADKWTISLVLLVNPESMNHGRTNTVQSQLTRKGFVIQPWGPNQDMLSAQGRTAAFMTTDEGLAMVTSRSSASYHNLAALASVYRNNGYIYKDRWQDKTTKGHSRVIDTVRGVAMQYDGDEFEGHFNTFILDNDAANPFTLNFNFEFVCSSLSMDADREVRGHFLPVTDNTVIPKTPLVNSVQAGSN